MEQVWDHARPADHELVASARAGAGDAFAVLVHRYNAPLLAYFVRFSGDPELAADLAQETFLAAFRRLDRLSEDRSFAAWLYQIARNQLRSEWRRRQLRTIVSLDWLLSRTRAPVPALGRADEAARYPVRDQVQRALDDLSPALREALLLHHLGGFRGQEVADVLGISVAAARKRIGRADAEFRRRFAAEEGHAPAA